MNEATDARIVQLEKENAQLQKDRTQLMSAIMQALEGQILLISIIQRRFDDITEEEGRSQ